MKNKKLRIIIVSAVLVLAALLLLLRTAQRAPAVEYGKELLVNGHFDQQSDSWLSSAYITTPGYSDFAFREGEGVDGSNALYIRNNELNDARFWQEVSVAPDTLYLITATIRAKAEGGHGANVSVEDIYVFSDSVYDTDGQWQTVSLCGRTGKNQTSLVVYIRLGGYSGEAIGEAWFDSVSVTAVAQAPADMAVYSLARSDTPEQTGAVQRTAAALIVLTSLLFTAACAALSRVWHRDVPVLQKNRAAELGALAGILLLALAIRLIAALTVSGYDVDVTDFRIWADLMYEKGPAGFYTAAGFCDYPPGYLLILWPLGWIGHFAGGTGTLLVKLPSILADLGTCVLLYHMAGKKKLPALATALLYALNPMAVCAGPAWGQGDSVMTLLLLLVVWRGMKEDWLTALPLYGLSVLVKPQSLMFGPLGLAAAALSFHHAFQSSRQGTKTAVVRDFCIGFGVMAGLMASVVLPFSIGQGGVGWLFRLYANTMGYYSFATVNACNLYFLFGLNWAGTAEAAPAAAAMTAALILTVPLAVSVFLHRRREKWAVLAACALLILIIFILSTAGGLTLSLLGYLLIAFSIAEVLYLYLRSDDGGHLPLCGAALLCLMFAGGTMMHERYLFPASALLLAAWLKEKDRRILLLFLFVTLSCFLNTACVLDRNIRIGGASGHLNAPLFGIRSDLAPLEYISAVINTVCAPLALYVCADRCRADAPDPAAVKEASAAAQAESAGLSAPPDFLRPEKRGRMDGRDWAILGLITAAFCAFTLYNLGSTKAPQTSCVLPRQEGVVLDLGEETDFQVLYYPGIHYSESSTMTLEISSDGTEYLMLSEEVITPGDCFRWIYGAATGDSPVHGRYLRVTAMNTGITLFEILVRTPDGVPIALAAPAQAAALADEPDTLDGEPGWFNSMYFDEIYHGRTAYELLHGLSIYEWTHPPLGKVLMSVCVALFGMTPFGWRFAGAMMGVLMIPGLYLTARLLLRRRSGAVCAVLLLCLDFMHFTQTRIATIDSFVVCFIIWSYYFMLCWFFLDYWKQSFLKTLLPLLLSGISIGLAIASKWTGCYAGVGLAVLFFWGFFRRAREYALVRKEKTPENGDEDTLQRTQVCLREGRKRLAVTIACCFGFFIAIPLLIYYCSYIPFFAASGGVTVQRIIDQCKGMLSYHAEPGRGMEHYFYSPWYEWPLIIKPMWFFSTGNVPQGYGSTIVTFGNPAVWWTGLAALVMTGLLFARRHFAKEGLRLRASVQDPVPAILIISFLAQFLPWVLVPRGTYIYHYFASVPFIILANAYLWDLLGTRKERIARIGMSVQILLALALFIAFFPYLSGVAVSVKWLEAMKWFPNWLFY